MLGSDLTSFFKDAIGADQVCATDYDTLDITVADSVKKKLGDLMPGLVINAAAYTDVDGAECNREAAYRLNVIGPKNLADACSLFGSKLIHFSTDYVFDGTGNRLWTEEDMPNPSNYYAETKLQGEEAVRRHRDSLVIRLQWLYGGKRDRFTILKKRESFTPFSDQYGAPTWTREVCKTVKELSALDAAFFGELQTPWTSAAERLHRGGWLTPRDADQLKLLWWFGDLIGNTDMHYGNISLFLDRHRPLSLAPSYDMLPMLYRPDAEGGLPDRPFMPLPPPPEALPFWAPTSAMAETFWTRVAGDPLISASFRGIAGRNAEQITRYRRQF